MTDDERGRRPSQPSAEVLANLPRTAVTIVGAPLIQGEIKLSDGTILNVMVVIPGVTRVDGIKQGNGSPVYELQSQVVMGVKHFERGQ